MKRATGESVIHLPGRTLTCRDGNFPTYGQYVTGLDARLRLLTVRSVPTYGHGTSPPSTRSPKC